MVVVVGLCSVTGIFRLRVAVEQTLAAHRREVEFAELLLRAVNADRLAWRGGEAGAASADQLFSLRGETGLRLASEGAKIWRDRGELPTATALAQMIAEYRHAAETWAVDNPQGTAILDEDQGGGQSVFYFAAAFDWLQQNGQRLIQESNLDLWETNAGATGMARLWFAVVAGTTLAGIGLAVVLQHRVEAFHLTAVARMTDRLRRIAGGEILLRMSTQRDVTLEELRLAINDLLELKDANSEHERRLFLSHRRYAAAILETFQAAAMLVNGAGEVLLTNGRGRALLRGKQGRELAKAFRQYAARPVAQEVQVTQEAGRISTPIGVFASVECDQLPGFKGALLTLAALPVQSGSDEPTSAELAGDSAEVVPEGVENGAGRG